MEYHRTLPHYQPDGAALFITLRLLGTLPLYSGRDGRSFATSGRDLARLGSNSVMPNRVYLLIEPTAPAPKITQYVKAFPRNSLMRCSAGPAKTFWQDESFDRWVRSLKEGNNSSGIS